MKPSSDKSRLLLSSESDADLTLNINGMLSITLNQKNVLVLQQIRS